MRELTVCLRDRDLNIRIANSASLAELIAKLAKEEGYDTIEPNVPFLLGTQTLAKAAQKSDVGSHTIMMVIKNCPINWLTVELCTGA